MCFRLRVLLGGCTLLFSLCVSGRADEPQQDAPAHRAISDVYIVRTAEQLQSPHVVTYRLVEYEQVRGRWILPDLAYYDTGYAKDQLWLVGVGAKLVAKPRLAWMQEIYFTQEAGRDSTNKRSLRLWPVVDARFPRRFTSQVVPYPTIPLDGAQRVGFNIDRARLQWDANSRWRTGIGYSGGIGKDRTWQSMPFASITRTTRAGEFDCWLQRTRDGGQVQVRYMLVHHRE